MPVIITYLGARILPRVIVKRYKVTINGGSYANGGAVGVGGEVLNINTALNPNYYARPKIPSGPPAARLPANTEIEAEIVPNGYTAQIEQDAAAPTPANYHMRIFGGGSGNVNPTELANGTYASYGLTAATFVINVTVPQKYS